MSATRVRWMQTRWTIMKLVILALALTSVARVERTPDRVSVRISADYAGTLTAVEVNGTRFSREEWIGGEGRRWLLGTLLACGADGSLTVDFQVDDSIRWEEAYPVMRVAFDTEVEPEVFILAAGYEGQRIPIWRPNDSAPDDSAPEAPASSREKFTYVSQVMLAGGEFPSVILNSKQLADGLAGIELLREQSVSFFQGFTVTPKLQIDAAIRFRWVRAAMKALSVEGKSTTTSDSKTRFIHVDGLVWLPPLEEPYRTHGGVI